MTRPGGFGPLPNKSPARRLAGLFCWAPPWGRQRSGHPLRTGQRIAPSGAVYAGSTGASAQAAAQAAALAKAASQVAYGGTKDGKVIFDNLCTACHTLHCREVE